MDFGDSLSTDLPAPRDDEPAGLRRDILDELADHLACSYNRELLRGADAVEARRRAIERFGDPAAVARRLWLDAMKGKIMAQRVWIATCLVMMAACFGVVGMVWIASSRSAAEAAEANRRLAEVLGQTQATNQEMLRQLQAIAKASQSPKSPDWIPVTLRLTMVKPDGPPAVGYKLRLGRGYQGSQKSDAIHRLSDAEGVADFGVVQPGDWEYAIEAGPWKATGGLNVVPGSPVVKEIVCPQDPPDRAQVKVRVDWPGPPGSPMAGKDLAAVAWFRREGETYQPPLAWTTHHSVRFLCRSRGAAIQNEDPQLFLPESGLPEFFREPYIDRLLASGRIHGRMPADPAVSEGAPLEVDAGRYSLDRLWLFRPLSDRPDADGREFQLLSLMNQDLEGNQVFVMNNGQAVQTRFVRGRRMERPADRFEARPGQVVEWVIALPSEMVKEAEKRLQAGAKPAKPSQAGATGEPFGAPAGIDQ